MRVKAGKEAGVIDQPCLCIFGTAIPKHYYEALSLKMLTNGFFARMLILETGKRGRGQDAVVRDLPSSVLEAARWWVEFAPGEQRGNLADWRGPQGGRAHARGPRRLAGVPAAGRRPVFTVRGPGRPRGHGDLGSPTRRPAGWPWSTPAAPTTRARGSTPTPPAGPAPSSSTRPAACCSWPPST